jgi:mRNA interferase MazF
LTAYEPEAGDLVWTDFDPRLGREQGGRRPALILSPVAFWRATAFAFAAPITSRIRPFPSSIVLPDDLRITGEVVLGQTRSVDTLAQPLLFSGGKITANLLAEARTKLALLLGIEV